MALANMGFKKTKVGLIWGEENKPYGEKEKRRGRGRRRREEEEPRSSQQSMETEFMYGTLDFWYGTLDFCMETTLGMDFVLIIWNVKALYG